MGSYRAPGWALAVVASHLLTLSGHAIAAERIFTSDGQRLVGDVVAEDDTELRLRTAHGTVTIPRSAILSRSGGQSPGGEMDPPRRRALRQRALEALLRGRYDEALAGFRQLLRAAPDDPDALYNTACAYARSGEHDEALAFLEEAIAAGFRDLGHVARDPDLRSLRQEEGYRRLIEQAGTWVRRSTRRATRRLQDSLRQKGASAEYAVYEDDETAFVYLHTKPPERLAFIRGGLERYAGLQRRDLFTRAAASALHIVLLAPGDHDAVLPEGVGGLFQPGSNTLICGDMPAAVIYRSNVVIHELTHAVHFADQTARGQRHPIWIIEGLATLFESATVVEDRLVPRHSARLATLRRASRRDALIPWRELMQMDQAAFLQRAAVAYPQARYVLFYTWEQGHLERFYEEYTRTTGYQSDPAGIEALEVAFGKPLDEIRRDWEVWLGEKRAPPTPYLGVSTEPGPSGGLVVTRVRPRSAAANGGLQLGDTLLTMDGSSLRTVPDLLEVLSTREVGDEVFVELRRGGLTLQVYLTLGRRGGR